MSYQDYNASRAGLPSTTPTQRREPRSEYTAHSALRLARLLALAKGTQS